MGVAVALFDEGTTTVTYLATDRAGNVSAPQTIVVRIDRTPPVIALTTPPATAGVTYPLAETVISNYACTDGVSGVWTCAGPVPSGNPIDTASAGEKRFTVTAADGAGNLTVREAVYVVKKASATLSLTSSRSSSKSGEAVTFTASLGRPAGLPAATGVVQFFDGSTAMGEVALAAPYRDPVFTFTFYGAESHAITARYSGDLNFEPVDSPVVNQVVTEQPRHFTVVPIDPPVAGAFVSAAAINNRQEIVGGFDSGGQRAFVHRSGRTTDLGASDPTWVESWADDINDTGVIVGYSYRPDTNVSRAFSLQDGQVVDLGTLGGPSSWASGINGAGHVAGGSFVAGASNEYHAFLYRDGGMQDLGTIGGTWSTAIGLNERDEVVGIGGMPDGTFRPFLYRPDGTGEGTMSDLGSLGGGWGAAQDVNDAGQIVGWSTTSSGHNQAFLHNGNEMIPLGALGGNTSSAYAINNAGQIVGAAYTTANQEQRAFIYADGVMTDLTALLPPGTDEKVQVAAGINDAGDIIAEVVDSTGSVRAVMLTFNRPPVATASASPNPVEASGPGGGVITLDGSASSDPDGNALSFLWQEGEMVLATTAQAPVTLSVGSHALTLTVTDTAGATDTVTLDVTVTDQTPPVVTLTGPDPLTVEGATPFLDPGATAADVVDGDLTAAISVNDTVNTAVVGAYSVTYSATDRAGNTGAATRVVNVVDTRPPVLTVPAGVTAEAIAPGGAFVTYAVSATDAVNGSVAVSCSAASGALFPLGDTTVTCETADATGNTTRASFVVTVRDTQAPAVRIVNTTPDTVITSTSWPVYVEVSDAVGVTTVRINGLLAVRAWGTPQSGTWVVSVPVTLPVAVGGALTFGANASDGAGNTRTAANVVVDNDGIPTSMDRRRSDGADQSSVFSNEFVNGATQGTITDRAGRTIYISPGISRGGTPGAYAYITGSGGRVVIRACGGSAKEVWLDQTGEYAWIHCAAATQTVTFQAIRALSIIEARKFVRRIWSSSYWTTTNLATGQYVATGSPFGVVSDDAATDDIPENTDPVTSHLIQIDDAGTETIVGTIVLDPNDRVDVDFAEGPNGEVVLDLEVLAGSVQVTVGGQTLQLEAGEPVPLLPVGAREALRGVLNALTALQPSVSAPRERQSIDAAIRHLTSALQPELWVSVLAVAPQTGSAVFQETKNAATRLRQLVADRNSSIPTAATRDLVERLLTAARLLASVAMDAAAGGPASSARDAGDRDAADMKVESAIEHYRTAWQHAVR